MTFGSILLIAALATPLAMLLACISQRLRRRICGWLAVAPLPGLAAAVASSDQVEPVQFPPPFRMTLALDRPGALLLGTAALLWGGCSPGPTPGLICAAIRRRDALPNGGC
jgi:hypothetical protein